MQTQKVKLKDIKIPPGRMRIEFGDLGELKESIERDGLLNPLTVRPDLTLVCGERRYRACKALGMEEIDVRILPEDYDDVKCMAIEINENKKRKDFTWQEEMRAIVDYFDAVKKQQPDVTQAEIARELSVSPGWLSIMLQLSVAAEKYPDIMQAATAKNAYNTLKKRLMLEATNEEVRRAMEAAQSTSDEDLLALAEAPEDKPQLDYNVVVKSVAKRLHCGDCLDLAKSKLKDESIRLALMDPPWGVEIQETVKGGASGHFRDDKDYAFDLLEKLFEVTLPKMQEHSLICLFFPIHLEAHAHVHEVANKFGLYVDPVPMVWVKEANSFANQSPNWNVSKAYEPIYWIAKGQPYINRPTPNVFLAPIPRTDRYHPTQKPVSLYQQLIAAFTRQGELVFDPTFGSGASMIAAESLGRNYIGFEQNQLLHAKAIDLCAKAYIERKSEDNPNTAILPKNIAMETNEE